jgi:hypothetical protein
LDAPLKEKRRSCTLFCLIDIQRPSVSLHFSVIFVEVLGAGIFVALFWIQLGAVGGILQSICSLFRVSLD